MADPYRAIRQLERFLFRGVPEKPQPMWPGDQNTYAPGRFTGRPQTPEEPIDRETFDGLLITTIIYRPDAKEVEVVPGDIFDSQDEKPDPADKA